jgi:hypothetical protein
MSAFFEAYILDVIGELSDTRRNAVQAIDLQRALTTTATEWRAVVRESLHLSDTIDIAILDLWYVNKRRLAQQGSACDPAEYAQRFADQYLAENSQIDVWPEGALEAAKKRIAQHRPG